MHAINVLFIKRRALMRITLQRCVFRHKFGVTPSMKYTEREVCSGASQGQWGHDDLRGCNGPENTNRAALNGIGYSRANDCRLGGGGW